MAAATMYVTPAGALGKTGADWANAMGEAEFEADLEAGAEAGDIYYVQAGTYTLDSSYDSSARDATAVAPISIIGVKAATTAEPPAYSDWGVQSGTDMPTFACGAWTISFGDYYHVYNCKFTGTATAIVLFGVANIIVNCIGNNTNGTSRTAFYGGTYDQFIFCTCTGAASAGIRLSNGRCLFSYFYSLGTGAYSDSGNETFMFNVFDTCSVAGISTATRVNNFYSNNTFNDCAIGVSITTGWGIGINNIFEGCSGHGVLATTAFNCGYWHKNHGDDARNTDMWDGINEAIVAYMDNACSTGDPLFDAANFNNSLAAGSPCINNALTPVLGCP